jgi:hypothetical protein
MRYPKQLCSRILSVIPEIDIWRAANLMLRQYGGKTFEESAARADELAAQDDYSGEAICGQRKRQSITANSSISTQ